MVGDVLTITPNMDLPADGLILESEHLLVNEHFQSSNINFMNNFMINLVKNFVNNFVNE